MQFQSSDMRGLLQHFRVFSKSPNHYAMASPLQTHEFEDLIQKANWLILIDVLNLELIKCATQCAGNLMLVFSRESFIEWVETGVESPFPEKTEIAQLLIGEETLEVPWFYFNDNRQDGPLPLEVLQQSAPNLSLRSVEMRQQITLGQLLERWEPAEEDGGLLILGDKVSKRLLISGGSRLK